MSDIHVEGAWWNHHGVHVRKAAADIAGVMFSARGVYALNITGWWSELTVADRFALSQVRGGDAERLASMRPAPWRRVEEPKVYARMQQQATEYLQSFRPAAEAINAQS